MVEIFLKYYESSKDVSSPRDQDVGSPRTTLARAILRPLSKIWPWPSRQRNQATTVTVVGILLRN